MVQAVPPQAGEGATRIALREAPRPLQLLRRAVQLWTDEVFLRSCAAMLAEMAKSALAEGQDELGKDGQTP